MCLSHSQPVRIPTTSLTGQKQAFGVCKVMQEHRVDLTGLFAGESSYLNWV